MSFITPRTHRSLAVFVALCSLCSPMFGFAQEQPKPLKELPPVQWMRGSQYDLEHVKLDIRFDWQKEAVAGVATLTLKPSVPGLRRVELDAGKTMTFGAIATDKGVTLSAESKPDIEKLYITLDRDYRLGETVTLVIPYESGSQQVGGGLLGSFGNGLVFIKPTEREPNLPYQIWSQGETQYNHNWFPCYDFPNDKITSEMIVTVEKKYTAVSNGKLLSKKERSDGTHTFHWRMDQPHAVYLTSVAVGEFEKIEQKYDDVPVDSYVYKSNFQDAKRTVSKIADMVKTFSEKTGVKYPYPKYAQVMLAKFGGGMENISSTHLTDTTVHDDRAALDAADDSNGLLAHELAHQWFGDLVTCRDWSEIWLNESFATYFDAVYVEKDRGRDEYLHEMANNQAAYFRAWNQGVRRPIVTKYFNGPDSVFDVYAYPRGAAVLGMLRFVLGDEAWWRGITLYLTRHKFQPVETSQFRRAMEEASGVGLDWFFDQWVYKMGHPIFEVSQTYDQTSKSLTLKIKQTQTPLADERYPQAEYFRTPVAIGFVTAGGEKRVERIFLEAKPEQSFSFPFDAAPKVVAFDHENQLIKELKFEKSPDELRLQIALDPDPMGRMWAIRELTRITQPNDSAALERTVAALAQATKSDAFRFVRREAAEALGAFSTDAVRVALSEAMKDADSQVRRAAVEGLAKRKDASLGSELQRIAETDRSYYVAAAAYAAMGQVKAPNAYDALVKAIGIPSHRNVIRRHAFEGLVALGDARALKIGYQYAKDASPQSPRADALQLVAAYGKGQPEALKTLTDVLQEAFEKRTPGLGFAALQAIDTLGDPGAIPTLESLQLSAPPQVRQFMTRIIEKLKKSATP
jgi:aminopeptidase N